MTKNSNVSYALVIALLLMASLSGQVNAQGVRTNTHTGRVELLRQDEGYVIISAKTLPFSNEHTQIYLENTPMESQVLDEGMVVRYTLDSQGNLLRIDILGPANKLLELTNN
ncbi:MAG: hypothetical protein COC19_04230 [SAR86 cluster bacterium]|uniref:Uncharacterized protein n=1 Tax=SAR86 cluster bacterium TaxID=2030880 RepID=A0A2A4MPE7_9GAMM|nr:MAG: hypothetical protein COC19_04230 [SAR86 cluster bacterium]